MEKKQIDYISLMKRCLEAWNQANAELVASFYSDNLDYRDPVMPQGISNKADFIKYLHLMFQVWPKQQWTPKNVMPHVTEGAFSVDYDFSFANNRTSITGHGIDRIEFKGDKISLNHVYLNAEKWKDWINLELKKAK